MGLSCFTWKVNRKDPLIGVSSYSSIQKSAAPEMLLALMDGAYTGSTIGMEVQILNLKIAIQSHLIQYFLNFLKILNLKLLIGSSIGANSSNTLPQDQTGDAAGSGNISRQQKRVFKESVTFPNQSALCCPASSSRFKLLNLWMLLGQPICSSLSLQLEAHEKNHVKID
ncbi:hypothetical protein Tco_1457791 [Tanacetum coccineum]